MYRMRKVFAEAYAVLQVLGDKYISKIPMDIWCNIEKERDESYIVNLDGNKPIDEQEISAESISLVFAIKREYWCDSDEERAKLLEVLKANEQALLERLKEATSTREFMRLIGKK